MLVHDVPLSVLARPPIAEADPHVDRLAVGQRPAKALEAERERNAAGLFHLDILIIGPDRTFELSEEVGVILAIRIASDQLQRGGNRS